MNLNLNNFYSIAASCTLIFTLYPSDKLKSLIAITEYERSTLMLNELCHKELYCPYIINLNHYEITSGKTFKELFNNAQKRKVPWILCPVEIAYPEKRPAVYMVDIVEAFKTSYMHLCTDFSSLASIGEGFFSALRICLSKKHPLAKPLYARGYHCISKLPSSELDYTSYLCHCIDKYGKQITYSDISCTLAIVFSNNYSQLLPLIECLKTTPEKTYTKKFWNETFQQLPPEQKADLNKIFMEKFCKETL